MSADDDYDGPIVVTTRCRHFWRQRHPIPMHSPIAGGPGDRYIKLPTLAPMCRACAGSITTRPMTEAEFDALLNSVRER